MVITTAVVPGRVLRTAASSARVLTTSIMLSRP
jgi:hypothetical protein